MRARGHWALDYSYALAGALRTEDLRSWERDLLIRYLDRLAAAGVGSPPGFDQAWLAYRQHPMHALVFGLFTLGGSRFEPELQPRDYTLWAIQRIARQVATWSRWTLSRSAPPRQIVLVARYADLVLDRARSVLVPPPGPDEAVSPRRRKSDGHDHEPHTVPLGGRL